MRAGGLRWTAAVQAHNGAKLASGAPDPAGWKTLFSRRCHVQEISGSKAADGAGQKQAVAYYDVLMRKTVILPSYRFVISGAPFDGLTMYVSAIRSTLTQTSLTCVVRANQ